MQLAKFLIGSVLLAWVVACGPSQDEYDAQLAKYEKLSGLYQQEQASHAAAADELEKTRARVKALQEKLQQMGVNVENLSAQLEAEGTEKDRLTANLEEMRAALEEYKKRAAQLERIRKRFEVLRGKLKKLTDLGLKVSIRHNRMVISLPGDVLFASGSDKLKTDGKEVLAAVADVIRKDKQLMSRYFQVAGHTDSQPLKGGRFGDNWGLSAMRARQVLVYLIGDPESKAGGGGLDPSKLHAAGYGETDPVSDNSTPEGRTGNRRVELVLMPDVSEMLDLKSLI